LAINRIILKRICIILNFGSKNEQITDKNMILNNLLSLYWFMLVRSTNRHLLTYLLTYLLMQ